MDLPCGGCTGSGACRGRDGPCPEPVPSSVSDTSEFTVKSPPRKSTPWAQEADSLAERELSRVVTGSWEYGLIQPYGGEWSTQVRRRVWERN